MNFEEEIKKLQNKVEGMRNYLLLKVEVEDWHGVADAAMDIRELEAKKKTLEEVIELKQF
jgi:hypothetical protein